MPPFRPDPISEDRSIYALDAKHNEKNKPLEKYSAMLLKWPYKLIEYRGLEELKDKDPLYKLFNLEDDPEELSNLMVPGDSAAQAMIDELQDTLRKSDQPYL